MKQFFLSLRVLGLAAILVVGSSLNTANAGNECNPKNPIRGVWSLSQTVPYLILAPDEPPVSGTTIGNAIIDECGEFRGEAVANFPSLVLPFVYFGSCGNPNDNAGLFNCTVNSPAFGLVDGGRACVASEKKGGCYQRFSCVISDATVEPNGVLLAEFTRQKSGTCQ